MYHYPTQQIYHHNAYQQCSMFVDPNKQHLAPSLENDLFHVNYSDNVPIPDPRLSQKPTPPPENSPKKEKPKKKAERVTKTTVDTSNFSIEERLVAAVWVHERKRTKTSMSQIKHNFRQRFGREPPAKNTLLVWERKLFATGNVCDAPRTGRPIHRRSRMEEVAESVRVAPSLSLRARAVALRVPRTTLRTILRRDLTVARDVDSAKPTKTKSSKPAPKPPPVPSNAVCQAPNTHHIIHTHTYT